MTTQVSPSIYSHESLYVTTPFEGDVLERSHLAKRLTQVLERMSRGGVVAIDAGWGEGKTWFGRNWHAQLTSEWPAAYVDAFANDHVEDPFLLIAAEFLELIDDRDEGARPKLAALFARVGWEVTKGAARFGAKAAMDLLPGGDELQKTAKSVASALGEQALQSADTFMQDRLHAVKESRRNVEALKEALAEFAGKQSKPVLIFIDELDRCKPDFALKMLERLKHFFDVPKVVFVLLVNRKQLESAAAVRYGEAASTNYLDKFVHLWFRLPKHTDPEQLVAAYERVLQASLQRFGEVSKEVLHDITASFPLLAAAARVSLRHVERAATLFLLVATRHTALGYTYRRPMSWLVFLKVTHPTVFAGILRGADPRVHEQANIVASNLSGAPGLEKVIAYWIDFHGEAAGSVSGNLDERAARVKQEGGVRYLGNLLLQCAREIDADGGTA